jgi:hypothetical protein
MSLSFNGSEAVVVVRITSRTSLVTSAIPVMDFIPPAMVSMETKNVSNLAQTAEDLIR